MLTKAETAEGPASRGRPSELRVGAWDQFSHSLRKKPVLCLVEPGLLPCRL